MDMHGSAHTRSVFVIHGRNIAAKEAMFQFLTSLQLSPLEWDQIIAQMGIATPYIGQILEYAFSIAQAAIVLMTPDEITRLKPQFLRKDDPPDEQTAGHQPRPNVLFEAGMALGCAHNRTILVEVGKVRAISDLAGRYTVRMDGSHEKRNEIVTRLRTAGCEVNIDGSRWLSAGDFAKAIEVGTATQTLLTTSESLLPSGLGGNLSARPTDPLIQALNARQKTKKW